MDEVERVEVVIEVPRFGFVKRDAGGRVDIVSPIPCPFNYGSVPGTRSADGDPLDAVVLGVRRSRGSVVHLPVRGTVDFVDAGDEDPKLIVSSAPVTAWEDAQIRSFFQAYAVLKTAINAARGRFGTTAYRGWTRAG